MLWLHAQVEELTNIHREYMQSRLGGVADDLPSGKTIEDIRAINGFFDYLITNLRLQQAKPWCDSKPMEVSK